MKKYFLLLVFLYTNSFALEFLTSGSIIESMGSSGIANPNLSNKTINNPALLSTKIKPYFGNINIKSSINKKFLKEIINGTLSPDSYSSTNLNTDGAIDSIALYNTLRGHKLTSIDSNIAFGTYIQDNLAISLQFIEYLSFILDGKKIQTLNSTEINTLNKLQQSINNLDIKKINEIKTQSEALLRKTQDIGQDISNIGSIMNLIYIAKIPLTYAYSTDTNFGKFTAGVNTNILLINSTSGKMRSNSLYQDFKNIDFLKNQYLTLGLDVGFLYQNSNNFNLALVINNITNPNISKNNKMGTQARAGVWAKPFKKLELTADLDLNKNQNQMNKDIQKLGFGANISIVDNFSIRFGFYKNIANNADTITYTAGVTVYDFRFSTTIKNNEDFTISLPIL